MTLKDMQLYNTHKTGLALLILFCVLLGSCQNDLKKLPNIDEMRLSQNDHAQNVRFIFSKNGRTKATLESDTFIQNNNARPPYIDLKKNLKLTSYDSLLHVESVVTASFARYFPGKGNVIVRDNVIVVNQKGNKLETEELIWNQQLQRFYTDKFVRINMDDQMTYGEGLEANQDFTWFRIKKQKGTIPVDKSQMP